MKHRVSKETYKKCFLILAVVFAVMFVAELVSVLAGNPITEIHITGLDLEKDIFAVKLFRAFLSACFIGGIFNIFLTVKVAKESRGKDRLPTAVVIIMTLLFPLEILMSGVLVVPNIIFWGVKAFTKSKIKAIDNEDICLKKETSPENDV